MLDVVVHPARHHLPGQPGFRRGSCDDKRTRQVLDTRIGFKAFKIVCGHSGGDTTVNLDETETDAQVLDEDALGRIVDPAVATERHNGCPQDLEWAIAAGAVWLVQARPITTLSHLEPATAGDRRVLARGLPAAPGTASGRVRVLRTPADGTQLLDGEVLVAPMTNPDWLPTIRRAVALVTDTGGMTCHAAIVARELGVPYCTGSTPSFGCTFCRRRRTTSRSPRTNPSQPPPIVARISDRGRW